MIILTKGQREALNVLWHIYGNQGSKSNHNQHRFIQTILEHGVYNKGWLNKSPRMTYAAKTISPNNNFNDYLVSDECIQVVDKILSDDRVSEQEIKPGQAQRGPGGL